MNRKQIVVNALTTFAEQLAGTAVLFLLYRFLFHAIGIERLGIWSLVLATTSVITLANQGFSTSIVKFVALYTAREQPEEVSLLIHTALVSISAAFAAACLILYPASQWILKIVLPHSSLPAALAILPWALVSLWINISGDILLAGLSGHQLISQRNYLLFGSSAFYFLLALLFVPHFGLLGLAYSQALEAAASFLAAWFLLRRQIPAYPLIPRRWSRARFREMLAYSAQFQFITVCQALREPATKALLTKFGGLAMTGFYDLASRSVVTVRELLVQANQVLVPTIATLQERDPETVPRIYRESYRLIFFLALPSFAFLVTVSPLVSLVWLGSYQPVFIRFVEILAAGWLINVLCNPAYVVDLGTGALRWVSIGCATTAIMNLALGLISGKYFGGTATVAASIASLALGYLIVLVSYHFESRVPFRVLLPSDSAVIILSSLAGTAIFLPYFSASSARSLYSLRTASGLLAAALFIAAIPMWIHPIRKRLFRWVLARMPA